MNSIERRTIRHLLSVSATMLVPFVLIGALIAGWRGAALGIAIGFAIQTLAWALAQPLLLKMMRADVVDMTATRSFSKQSRGWLSRPGLSVRSWQCREFAPRTRLPRRRPAVGSSV